MSMRVALVTGANRGLGLETCRQLGAAGIRVILACRKEEDAREAAAALRRTGVHTGAEHVDVADADSVRALAERLAARGETLDVLVNNAGIALEGFDADVARRTIGVNYRGTVAVTDTLSPALRDHGRIVMVSSGAGELSPFSPELRARFLDPTLDRAGIDALVGEFIDAVAAGEHAARGWPSSTYRVSKAAMNAFTRLVARELAPRGILVNAVCPGWVRTDMGGAGATRGVEEGARGIVWGALLPDDGPTGGFFRDGRAIPW